MKTADIQNQIKAVGNGVKFRNITYPKIYIYAVLFCLLFREMNCMWGKIHPHG